MTRLAAALALLAAAGALASGCSAWEAVRESAGVSVSPARTAPAAPPPTIRWQRSQAVGSPSAGRLARGVRLPAAGAHFRTWDPVLRRSPNRHWRRWGTDATIRTVLRVARDHRRAHPGAPPLLVGDISRPGGGSFGIRFGRPGHVSHQNGRDVDVYYPRRDRAPRAPTSVAQIDRRLAQDLVDRFVAAGAEVVFVGPRTGLTGPEGRVQPLAHHDNHLHARLPPP